MEPNTKIITPLKTFFDMQFMNLTCGLTLHHYYEKEMYIGKHFYYYYGKERKGRYRFTTVFDKVLEFKDIPYIEYKENGNEIESCELMKILYTDYNDKRRFLFTKQYTIPGYILVNPRSFMIDFKNVSFSKTDILKILSINLLNLYCKPLLTPLDWSNYIGMYYSFNQRNYDVSLLNSMKTIQNENIMLVTDNVTRAKIDLFPLFQKNNNVTIYPENIIDTFELDISDQENQEHQMKIMQVGANLASTKKFYPFYKNLYSSLFIQFIRRYLGLSIDFNKTKCGGTETYIIEDPEVPAGSDC